MPSMKRTIWISLIFTCLFTFSVNAQQRISWLKNIHEANKIAAETGKLILLDFTGDWCKPCQKMDKEFWTRADVVELSSEFVCVKIDFDHSKNLVSTYRVRAIPTILMTDSWGLGLNFHVGFGAGSENQIVEKLGSIPKSFSEIKDASKLLKSNKNNLAALAKIAEFYQQRKFYYQSNEYYNHLLKLETVPLQRENLLLNIGFNNLHVGLVDDATEIFERFHKEFPLSKQLDMALYGKFLAFEQRNAAENSGKVLSELKAKFPKSVYVSQAEQILQKIKPQAK